MKKKLFVVALAGILAFGLVIAPSLSARAEESKTTQYDADKELFQPLIDAMFELVDADAFGKPTYTWTMPDLADFINKEIPNLKKEEKVNNYVGKDGKLKGKAIIVEYSGVNGNAQGFIGQTDSFLNNDEKISSNNSASYVVGNVTKYKYIQAQDLIISTNRQLTSSVTYKDTQAPEKLSSLDKALSLINDPELVNYIKTEREIDNNREYYFSDGTHITIIPNRDEGVSTGDPSTSVDTVFWYTFRNHSIGLSYNDGEYNNIHYSSRFTPISMFRLYNPNSGEHFYTANRQEADGLVAVGWHDEGLGWKAPLMSDTPVYRLYNPNSGDHHYTPNEEEKDNLIAAGWNYEGIGWYSFERETTPLYRLYNPNEKTGTHHYTTDEGERDFLVKQGWVDEGIGWYGM